MRYNRNAVAATIATLLIPTAIFATVGTSALASAFDIGADTAGWEALKETQEMGQEKERQPTADTDTEGAAAHDQTAAAAEDPAQYELPEDARSLIERVVEAEAGGEDFNGQALVAQCIQNTARAKGIRPEEVVQEAGQYVAPAKNASDSVKGAVAAVFDEGYAVTAEPIRFFYAPKQCTSKWHEESLEFVLEHGGHRFFKIRSDTNSSI